MARTYYRVQRRQAFIRNSLKQPRLTAYIWQSLFLIIIGAIIFLVNYGALTIHKTSGYVVAVHTLNNSNNTDWIELRGDHTVYAFNVNDLIPIWDGSYTPTPGQHVVIYYRDGNPATIINLSFASTAQLPSATYTTLDFQQNYSEAQGFPWGVLIGALIVLAGIAWLGRGIWQLLAELRPKRGALAASPARVTSVAMPAAPTINAPSVAESYKALSRYEAPTVIENNSPTGDEPFREYSG